MFRFFGRPVSTVDELQRTTTCAVKDIRAKWVQFDSTAHLKADVSLAEKIDLFVEPLTLFLQRKYPSLEDGGPSVFWLATFTAILESGTHPKDDVNAAIRELQNKYGPPKGRM